MNIDGLINYFVLVFFFIFFFFHIVSLFRIFFFNFIGGVASQHRYHNDIESPELIL